LFTPLLITLEVQPIAALKHYFSRTQTPLFIKNECDTFKIHKEKEGKEGNKIYMLASFPQHNAFSQILASVLYMSNDSPFITKMRRLEKKKTVNARKQCYYNSS